MAKAFKVEVTVPEGLQAGDTFIIEVMPPAAAPKARGQLAGIALEDMTDEQLRREIINAKSVLYKAKQRNTDEAVIAKNQARVDAAMAEKAKRTPVTATATATAVAAVLESNEVESPEADSPYAEDVAAEL